MNCGKQGIVMTAQIADQLGKFTRQDINGVPFAEYEWTDNLAHTGEYYKEAHLTHYTNQFAKHVGASLARFMRHDWGDVGPCSIKANDADAKGFEMGRPGRIIANYKLLPNHPKDPNRIWIVRDEQAVTVMFPEEY